MEEEAVNHRARAEGHCGREETIHDAGADELAVGARVRGAEDGGEPKQGGEEVDRSAPVDIGQGYPDKRADAVEGDYDGGLVGGLYDGDVEVVGELAVSRVDDGCVDGAEGGQEADLYENRNLHNFNEEFSALF